MPAAQRMELSCEPATPTRHVPDILSGCWESAALRAGFVLAVPQVIAARKAQSTPATDEPPQRERAGDEQPEDDGVEERVDGEAGPGRVYRNCSLEGSVRGEKRNPETVQKFRVSVST